MQKSKLTQMTDSLEKTLTLHSVIILVKSVFDKNQNHFFCNIL